MCPQGSIPTAGPNNERRGQLAMTTEPSQHWYEIGACRGMDRNLFVFQEPRGHLNDPKVIAAKQVCAGCPVIAECLADALSFDSIGVWGNTTEYERRVLLGLPVHVKDRRHTRVLPECGSYGAYRRHVRHDEPIDELCRVARNAYNARNKARIREAQAAA